MSQQNLPTPPRGAFKSEKGNKEDFEGTCLDAQHATANLSISERYSGPMAETNRRNELNLNPLEGMVSVYSSGRSDEHVQHQPPPIPVTVHYPAMTEPYHGPLDGTSRHPEREAMPMEAHVSAANLGSLNEPIGSAASPDPSTIFPLPSDRSLCFLKNIIARPNILVGNYTYYYDAQDIHNFEKNVVYHYECLGDKLIIGKFCQIGTNTTFIMNGGNHRYDGFSSYPFHAIMPNCVNCPSLGKLKKDTVVGNDVWIGYGATILPGISVGDGAIIGAASVVTKDIPPYTIVGGNPAREIRKRFDESTITFLLSLQWWNWPIQKVGKYANALTTGNIGELEEAANER